MRQRSIWRRIPRRSQPPHNRQGQDRTQSEGGLSNGRRARAALRAKGIDPTVIECAMMPKFLLPKPLLTGMLCSAM